MGPGQLSPEQRGIAGPAQNRVRHGPRIDRVLACIEAILEVGELLVWFGFHCAASSSRPGDYIGKSCPRLHRTGRLSTENDPDGPQ
jgi:hypothetical protein